MDENAKAILGWGSLVSVIMLSFIIWVTYTQETIGDASKTSPSATCTVTPTQPAVVIEFVDDIPVAVSLKPATATPKPTNTPTVTPTTTVTPQPTETPKPTQKPTEKVEKPTNTPRPTNIPTPTKTAQKTQNIVPYPTGAVGTQYVDSTDKHHWKPFARYTKITKKGSKEYELQQRAHTAENGLRVVTDPNGIDRYCIALEPQWAGGQSVDIGRCIDVKMQNGATLHCVLGDCKTHEKSYKQEGRYGSQGELLEFIADQPKLSEKVRARGDVSYAGAEFAGGVVSITVLDYYIEGFGR